MPNRTGNKWNDGFVQSAKVSTSAVVPDYIAKLEEYIAFLTDCGNKTAMYLAIHGMGDSQKDIDKGATLREELYQLRKVI